jgi:hypothetical protein
LSPTTRTPPPQIVWQERRRYGHEQGRGQVAVMQLRVRDAIRRLGPADRVWAADALVLLLAECRAAGPANGKGA